MLLGNRINPVDNLDELAQLLVVRTSLVSFEGRGSVPTLCMVHAAYRSSHAIAGIPIILHAAQSSASPKLMLITLFHHVD